MDETTKNRCASCGVAESGEIKLKDCSACHLVSYCSVKCQKEHRPTHKQECKKRAAELRDELLFKQPESSYLGDCTICCLPLSLDPGKSTILACCSHFICDGCYLVNQVREAKEKLPKRCPFCRQLCPKTNAEMNKRAMNRVQMKDPVAMREEGMHRFNAGDNESALKLYAAAAELGDVGAQFELARMYYYGDGTEKDESKAVHFYEKAAIGGHPGARTDLGCIEWEKGRSDRAIKHFLIGAKLGGDHALKNIKESYKGGFLSKEVFEEALRGHHAAVAATKSPEREAAYKSWHA